MLPFRIRTKVWLALGVIAALLVVAWSNLFPTPRLAQPTGPFAIGTRIYVWTDHTRPEPFTPDPSDARTVVVQVWYPALAGTHAVEAYLDRPEVIAVLAGRFSLPSIAFRQVRFAPTHTVRDATPANGRFPVLLNPAGFSGFRNASLFWIEELASHGYVVVGFDQPGTSAATKLGDGRVIPVMADKSVFDRYMPLAMRMAPDEVLEMNGELLTGGVVPFLAADLTFVLNMLHIADQSDPVLAGHLDLSRAGVFGMSLGGYVSSEACRLDERLRACLVADAGQTIAVAKNGLSQPVMIMSRDAHMMREERARAGGWSEEEINFTISSQRSLFVNNRADSYFLTMNGMFHINWTDAPVWSPIVSCFGLSGPIDPYDGFAQSNAFALAFFNRYLKGHSGSIQGSISATGDLKLEVRTVGQ